MPHRKHTPDHTPPVAEAATEGAAAAAPAAVTDQGDRIRELEEALAAREALAAENWDKFLRERADLENYRKRVQKEKEEILRYGNESIVQEMLPAVDNMERALAHVDPESQDPVIVGVRMTLEMLQGALKKFGVTAVAAEQGAPFDPALHQAMCQLETDQAANTIVEVMQKGYLLNERLLRPAMVTVAK